MVDYDNWAGSIGKSDLTLPNEVEKKTSRKKIPCVRSFDVAVLFNGDVRLCAARINKTQFDDMVIGNINENSLEDIFFSNKAMEVRAKFIEKKHPNACVGCSLYVPASEKLLNNKKEYKNI